MLQMRIFTGAIVALMLMTLPSCYTWKNVTLVENPSAETRPEVIEVSLNNGGTFDVHYPIVASDSVRGWLDKSRTHPVAFALSDVRAARTDRLSSERTAGMVVLGVLAGITLWALLIISAGGIAPQY